MLRTWFGRSTFFALLVVLGVLAWVFVHSGTASAGPVKIEIDASQRYQTMTGWEATLDLADAPYAPEWAPYHDELIDRAVDEIGINRVRLEIRSGAETRSDWIDNYLSGKIKYDQWKSHRYQIDNDNDDPNIIDWSGFDFSEFDWHIEENLLPMIAKMQERGEKLWINVCYVSFQSGPNVHRDPEEYAEFVLATYLHLQDKYGIVPDSWEVILEPDLERDSWTGEMIGHAMVATSRRLREAGFEPALIAPSVTDMSNTFRYVEDMARVPGAMDDVIEISYHRYRGTNRQNLREIAKLADRLGKKTSMLELWFGRANHNVLHEDLKIGNASSWQGRVLNGHFQINQPQGQPAILRPQPEMRYNLQYFLHVRSGAVRIGAASSSQRKMDPLAFQNPDGSTTLIIKAETAGDLEITGLSNGEYQVSYAVEAETRQLPGTIIVSSNEPLMTSIPAKGVLTLTSHRAPTPD